MNPDGFGVAVALTLPIAWYLAASFKPSKGNELLKFVNYAYVPLAFVGLALSGTRTALIASIVGMAYGLFTLTHLRRAARVAIFLLLVSVILLLLPRVQTLRSFERFDTTYSELTEGDLNNRTNNWREGMAAFVEHPLLGVGDNMYRSINSLDKVAHNTFLSVLVELGLVGFAIFGIILTVAILEARLLPKWDAMFWLAALLVWALGVSTLTWGDRKETWLLLALLIASGALTRHHDESVPEIEDDTIVGQFARLGRINEPGDVSRI
jgi:O-antigen ligase